MVSRPFLTQRSFRESGDDDLSTARTASRSSSSSSLESTPMSPAVQQEPRRNLRKSIVDALSSPVKVARTSMQSPIVSPRRLRKGLLTSLSRTGGSARNLLSPGRNEQRKSWRDELEVPPNTTKEEAVAILLCRELDELDL